MASNQGRTAASDGVSGSGGGISRIRMGGEGLPKLQMPPQQQLHQSPIKLQQQVGAGGPSQQQVGTAGGPSQQQLGAAGGPSQQQIGASGPSHQQVGASGPSQQQGGASGPSQQQVGASGPSQQQVAASGPSQQQVGASGPSQQQVGAAGGSGPQQPQQDYNMVHMCRIAQELIHELITKIFEIFNLLKQTQLPSGMQAASEQQQERRVRLQELLRALPAHLKNVRVCYTAVEEVAAAHRVEGAESGQGEVGEVERVRQGMNDYRELMQQLLCKQRQLKEVMDTERQMLWDINAMLSGRKL